MPGLDDAPMAFFGAYWYWYFRMHLVRRGVFGLYMVIGT